MLNEVILPEWLNNKDNYVPPKDSGTFVVRTIKTLGKAMGRIKIQKGHEKLKHLPSLVKLFMLVGAILAISLTRKLIVIMAALAILLGYLCTWPPRDILNIFKPSLLAAFLSLVLFAPAMFMNPAGAGNNLMVVVKVFISVAFLSVFNHTTQWNHITGSLRKLHIPGVFIFLLDMTLKYIVLLGNLIEGLLTSLQLRSVGKNNKKYSSIGGVMGVTFIRGAEMNQQMYEAMQCRGFTDDYEGL